MIEITGVRKLWTEEEVKKCLESNEMFLYHALMFLYNKQTDEEKIKGNTSEHNGVGFNAWDAPFLSAIARSYLEYGRLTKGQREKTIPLLQKYTKQLTTEANSSKYRKSPYKENYNEEDSNRN